MVFLKLFRKDFEVDDAIGRDGNLRRGFRIETSAGEHRGMLHRRHVAMPGSARLRGERESVCLGAAAGEDHVLGPRADEGRHLRPCRLDGRARRPPLGMNRGGIAIKREWRGKGLAHFGAKRCGGVVVEIGALVDAVTKLAADGRRLTLARAPVARAMKRGRSSHRSKCPAIPERLVWNNSNLKLYRFPERQSQVLRRRFARFPFTW